MIPHENAAPSVADLCRTIGDGGASSWLTTWMPKAA